ncbi:hypothetical protein CORC01_07610 [Colletotrichum orchidophilum]|uniref:Uncharacterized protein n=1 Tax=Colletotrichum orchidophilum TaxID=1209926 RepID=A0A1G4B6U8_9PEZI|nr:uncharacterized protein CORC01_07610 [Colletotrichum orchidophilum]OHE97169.1 hypothetical protein CORC01_07610 [Colletotrichum orchidophilum]
MPNVKWLLIDDVDVSSSWCLNADYRNGGLYRMMTEPMSWEKANATFAGYSGGRQSWLLELPAALANHNVRLKEFCINVTPCNKDMYTRLDPGSSKLAKSLGKFAASLERLTFSIGPRNVDGNFTDFARDPVFRDETTMPEFLPSVAKYLNVLFRGASDLKRLVLNLTAFDYQYHENMGFPGWQPFSSLLDYQPWPKLREVSLQSFNTTVGGLKEFLEGRKDLYLILDGLHIIQGALRDVLDILREKSTPVDEGEGINRTGAIVVIGLHAPSDSLIKSKMSMAEQAHVFNTGLALLYIRGLVGENPVPTAASLIMAAAATECGDRLTTEDNVAINQQDATSRNNSGENSRRGKRRGSNRIGGNNHGRDHHGGNPPVEDLLEFDIDDMDDDVDPESGFSLAQELRVMQFWRERGVYGEPTWKQFKAALDEIPSDSELEGPLYDPETGMYGMRYNPRRYEY